MAGIKKVIMIGCSETKILSLDSGKFSDPTFEKWGENGLYQQKGFENIQWTRWFEVHTRQSFDERGYMKNHVQELRKFKIPIYSIEHYPDVPATVKYPLDEIITKFRDYFTSSFSYMLAFAIYEKFDEVHFYGVDMQDTEEYRKERQCFEYWCGVADTLKIKLVFPDGCPILKTNFRYGYEDEKRTALIHQLEFRNQELKKLHAQSEKVRKQHETIADQYWGALQENDILIKIAKQ